MGISKLEKIEAVRLFSITEEQKVTELDSPVPGADYDIAQKTSLYEFFHSQEQAQKYIENLHKQYKSKNETLQLINDKLTGRVIPHEYSNDYEITHKINERLVPLSSLPEGIEKLLENPQRRIIVDITKEVPGGRSLIFPYETDFPYKFSLF